MESYRVHERPHIEFKNIYKSFGDRDVLNGINLKIQQGEFIAIVGKSGCGKSTLLRLLAGLDSVNDGKIMINNNPLTKLNQQARLMFQDGRLLPWKRVKDNIHIGLEKKDLKQTIAVLKSVGLADRISDWPRELSGGQKQRVALARALVHDPEILLLDEPLGALDALTRLEMQDLIETLWLDKKFTAVLVTHDVEEAVAIADRVIVMKDGIVQLNRTIELERPRERTNQLFQMYVQEILDEIMERRRQTYVLESVPAKKVGID